MDKIEKIRKEIERRKAYISVTHFAEELLSFLDTLSEEPDKSLEEAAKEYVKDIPTFKDSCLMKAAFKDGAEWKEEQMLKEAVDATSQDKISKIREKIEQEVKHWKEKVSNHYTIEAEARWSEASHILNIFDSIQQEQPDDKLTNIAYWLEYFGMPKENIENCTAQISQGYGAIRYLEGVQVGAEAVNELAEQEEHDKSLEEAADSAAIKAFPENKSYSTVVDRVVDYSAIDRKNYRDGFIAGSEWQAKQVNRDEVFHDGMRYAYDQLMKEAAKGYIANVGSEFDSDIVAVSFDGNHTSTVFIPHVDGRKYGDKVKLIIIKDDGKSD